MGASLQFSDRAFSQLWFCSCQPCPKFSEVLDMLGHLAARGVSLLFGLFAVCMTGSLRGEFTVLPFIVEEVFFFCWPRNFLLFFLFNGGWREVFWIAPGLTCRACNLFAAWLSAAVYRYTLFNSILWFFQSFSWSTAFCRWSCHMYLSPLAMWYSYWSNRRMLKATACSLNFATVVLRAVSFSSFW